MGCFEAQNNTWDSTLDYRVVYTGNNVTVAGVKIKQGDNYQTFSEAIIQAITNVDEKEYYTPYIKIDNGLTFEMTGEQVEQRHPEAPIGAIVYNDIEGFEFFRLANEVWKFQIIDIRK